MRKTLEQRFWAKVNKDGPTMAHMDTPCWVWTAARTPNGYGLISINGRGVGAHRFSYEMHFGSIPDGLLACHKCDNPSCVNPNHLFPGTTADNTRDMIAKGRRVITKGDAFVLTKITEAQVEEIRALWATGEYYQYEIAEIYGIVRTHVCNIVNGKARR